MSIKSNQGMSLVQILITTMVIAIIAASASSLFMNVLKQNQFLQTSIESIEVYNDLVRLVSDPTVCNLNFGGRNFSTVGTTPLAINSAQLPGGQFQQGTVYKGQQVQSFDLVQVRLEQDNPIGTPDIYSGVARIVFARAPGALRLGSQTSQNYDIGFYFRSLNGTTIDANGCIGLNNMDPAQLCASIGGSWLSGSGQCDVCSSVGGVYNPTTGGCDICTALGGSPNTNGMACDLCSALGGTRNSSNNCVVSTVPGP